MKLINTLRGEDPVQKNREPSQDKKEIPTDINSSEQVEEQTDPPDHLDQFIYKGNLEEMFAKGQLSAADLVKLDKKKWEEFYLGQSNKLQETNSVDFLKRRITKF